MELFPIIKLALTVFSILSAVVIIASYILYKLRGSNKKQTAAQPLQPSHPAINHVRQVEVGVGHAVAQAAADQSHYNEQIAQAQLRKKTVKIQKPVVRPRERFKVVNQQQNILRQQVILEEKPFYHPRTAESKRQIVSRKSFSLIENYSNGGEKLHKLNLAPNFS